jgi:dUTP pyrophosphatase
MFLKILPENQEVLSLYENHSTYHAGDSGLDLFFPEEVVVGPGETKVIDLKIKCEACMNDSNDSNVSYYLYPRSSISKTPLRMANSVGIIDAGYRGSIMVAVDNRSQEPYRVERGQRLFQICSPILAPISFAIVNALTDTTRGEGGFGSTGLS